MKKTIYVKISDVPFKLLLRNSRLEEFYEDFIAPPDGEAVEIEVSEEMLDSYSGKSRSAAEVFWQGKLVCDELVKRGKMIFHGCAFMWKGKAYIFTAPSGTGKTTQFMLWDKLYGNDVGILNGDKPVLELTDEGVFVRPSPWCGKECMRQMLSAPLEAIIYLRQAEENSIEQMEAKQAAQYIFEQILFSAPDGETVDAAALLAEKLINSVKLLQLCNRGDDESAMLCHDTLEEL